MSDFGLSDPELQQITRAVSFFKSIEKAVIYGSRALGTHKPYSDIDIVVFGKHVNTSDIALLKDHLEEETLLPYFFDVCHYSRIQNKALREHIDQYGVLLKLN